MQDGLGLIVGRVRGDDKACPHPPCRRFQRGVSSPACSCLDPLAAIAGRKIDRGRRNFAVPVLIAGQVAQRRLDRLPNRHRAAYDSRGRQSAVPRRAVGSWPGRRAGPRYRPPQKPPPGRSGLSSLPAATRRQGGFRRDEGAFFAPRETRDLELTSRVGRVERVPPNMFPLGYWWDSLHSAHPTSASTKF